MNYGLETAQTIPVDRVFLDQRNPRHEPFEDQEAVIEYLCRGEQVLPLARDIAKNRLNPLELFALLPEGDNAYIAAEGNRRLCAVQLLNDPDLAPADQRRDFERAAEGWEPISHIYAIIFDERGDVRLWLDRIHAGIAGGRGRRQWNAEQKTRNSGYSKNNQAQYLLDVAEELGFITAAQRKGRLSTVQRHLSNPLMRNTLGLDFSDMQNPTTDLREEDFRIILEKFAGDVAEKRITTRANSPDIQVYSNKLRQLEGVSPERITRRAISDFVGSSPRPNSPRPSPPKQRRMIPLSANLRQALENIPSYKLEKIYFSLCSIPLDSHTPLLCIGAWCLLETLTAVAGRKPKASFESYLSAQCLQNLGLGGRKETKSICEAVKRIAELGNSTKHNKTSAGFNGEQLTNDFETMEPMLIALAKASKGKVS